MEAARLAESNKKIAKGILQYMAQAKNTVTAQAEDNSDQDFGKTQFDLDETEGQTY